MKCIINNRVVLSRALEGPLATHISSFEKSLRVKTSPHKKGELIEDFDVAIAAHALGWDLCLVSNNTRHMGRVQGLRLEDWTVE